jgi:prepilin signal peptidase PulO-like enzyme (type II secretory pathway)
MFVAWLLILVGMLVLALYDLRWMILPDKVLLPLIVFALIYDGVIALHAHSWAVVTGPAIAAFVVGGFFYALAAVSKGRWMGGGDIKLVLLIGLLLGIQKTAVAMFLGFNSAAIVALALLALHLKKRTDLIPFGPSLIGGTFIASLYGRQIIDWYLNLIYMH